MSRVKYNLSIVAALEEHFIVYLFTRLIQFIKLDKLLGPDNNYLKMIYTHNLNLNKYSNLNTIHILNVLECPLLFFYHKL